jgi:uncharacterized damage-inducible protein DinB
MESFNKDYLDRLEELHQDVARAFDDLPGEALDWSPGDDIPSINALVTHLTGAERYWIGDVAGGVPSDRDRDAEFLASGLQISDLEARLESAQSFARDLLPKITVLDLERICISPRTGRRFTVAWALLHALEHTAIHLGHLQIIRQLWELQGD